MDAIAKQNFDCNCNNCLYLYRDFTEAELWRGYTEHLQYIEFLRNRRVLLVAGGSCMDNGSIPGYKEFVRKAGKLKFQFNKAQVTVHYGVCLNRAGYFSQPVTFMQDIYQHHTQKCFVNRKNT